MCHKKKKEVRPLKNIQFLKRRVLTALRYHHQVILKHG